MDKKEYNKADLETMFWQNRTEALTEKVEKNNANAVINEKPERGQQTVIMSSLEEGTAQGSSEKKVSSPSKSKPNASIEEGKAKKGKRKRVPDYQQKINKLKTKKQLKL